MSHFHNVGDLSQRHIGTESPQQPEGLSVIPTAVESQDEPISLDDAKEWLRVSDPHDQGGVLLMLIRAVREEAEKITRRLLVEREVTLEWARFYRVVDLPRPPIASVSKVESYNPGDDTWDTVDEADYDRRGRSLELHDGNDGAPLRVTQTSGYTTVPPGLKRQMLKDLRYSYDNRDPSMGARVQDLSAYRKYRPY